jgi:hypothetical protein
MLTGRAVLPDGSFLASAPVVSVKEAVHAASGIPVRHQRLIWESNLLGNDVLLRDLSLPTEGATFQLVVSLPPEHQVTQARALLQQAAAALDVLDARAFSELKRLSSPPAGVDLVLEAVMHLRAGIDPAIVVDSQGRVKDSSWKASKKMMNDPKKFLAELRGFKTLVENGSVAPRNVQVASRIRDSMGDQFSFDAMRRKSLAVGGLVVWVINIIQYHQLCEAIRADFEGFDIMTEIREQMAM